MKQYETIKMSPMRAVDIVLRGRGYNTPEVWNKAEKMVRVMAESATEKRPVLDEEGGDRWFRCPMCEARLVEGHNEYCHECGQAIKW